MDKTIRHTKPWIMWKRLLNPFWKLHMFCLCSTVATDLIGQTESSVLKIMDPSLTFWTYLVCTLRVPFRNPLETLFSINGAGLEINSSINLDADDPIIYYSSQTVFVQVFERLQSAFNLILLQLWQLRLEMNASETKVTLFSNRKKVNTVLLKVFLY